MSSAICFNLEKSNIFSSGNTYYILGEKSCYIQQTSCADPDRWWGGGKLGVRNSRPPPPPLEFWQKCGYRIREWVQLLLHSIYVKYNPN